MTTPKINIQLDFLANLATCPPPPPPPPSVVLTTAVCSHLHCHRRRRRPPPALANRCHPRRPQSLPYPTPAYTSRHCLRPSLTTAIAVHSCRRRPPPNISTTRSLYPLCPRHHGLLRELFCWRGNFVLLSRQQYRRRQDLCRRPELANN